MYDMRRPRPHPGFDGRGFFFAGPFVGGLLGGLVGSAFFRPRPYYPPPYPPYRPYPYGYGYYPYW